MVYLVTGGTGFIGSYVVRLLLQDSQQVVSYDLTPESTLLDKLVGKDRHNQLTSIIGDITDLAYLVHTCQENNVERIIHTAAIPQSKNPFSMMRCNCEGTLNVLETARILGIKKVVLVSTADHIGLNDKCEQEYIPNDALRYPPGSIYGASKAFNEACARHYFSEYGLDTIVIRFPHVYGFGRRKARMLFDEELFIKPALGKPGVIPGEYSGSINWLYVEDAARVLVMASKVKTTKKRSFTSSGDIRTIAEVAAYVKSIIPGADITLSPRVSRSNVKFDTTSLQEEIGFKPEWTIERAIKKVVDYLQEQERAGALFP